MNPASGRSGTRRLARGAVVVVGTGSLLLAAGPAFAQTDHPRVQLALAGPSASPHGGGSASGSSDQKPAVVGPLLDFFGFGAGIGLPLACQAGTSAIGSGAGELGLAEQAATVISKVNGGCDTASSSGVAMVQKGQQMAKPLNVINPQANAGLDAAAGTVEQTGQQYDETLAPFGPTIVGTGDTIRWLKGK